ncbi:MAG: sigma 54-dependent Fis family transcriptional regulator [Candidatus Hydrogenedentes bacterium]|nr:sigma 54-dependent Fis family transcriptional regulator [Candidatus Hydrogenedentota bacterium]
MGWILTSICRSHRGVHWDIEPGPVVLGHGAARDIVVNDPETQTRLCQLYIRGGDVHLQHLGGPGEVRVNGRPVQRAAIRPGDTISIGGADFTISRRAAEPPAEAADRLLEEALAEPDPRDEAAGYARAVHDAARAHGPLPRNAPPLSTVNGQRATESALLGDSPAMRDVRDLIRRIAPAPLGVLITGETGTGKELAAEMLHQHANRASGPFIAVNAAAIPEHLFESELFGHEKGAFTGADRKRRGKFAIAHGGTLFLDEIGDLSPENQARLLRVLEKGAFHPVGAERESRADVRVLAATNKDLHHAIRQGAFRPDLYHRLAAIEINLPPLRQRPGDIPALAHYFSTQYAQKLGAAPKPCTEAALEKLQNHPWPGNVRELKNTIERAAALSRGEAIQPDDLDLDKSIHYSPFTIHYSLNATLSEVERMHIARVLDHCGGNISQAARMLGVHRNTLHNRMGVSAVRECALEIPP